jgi:chemotaxis protein MotA
MFKSLGMLACGVYLVLASQMGGFSPGFSILFLTFLVMFAGTVAVMGLTAPPDVTRGAMKLIKEHLPLTHQKLIEELEEIALITRRDGLLALESKRKDLKEPLLRLLLKRIVEGFEKSQTLPLLRNQAMRRAELIRTCEVFSERVLSLIPVVGLIPSLFMIIDFLSHPEKVPAPGSLPTVFLPFLLALVMQLLGTAWSGRFFDEIKESVKLYYVIMEEGVSAIQDGVNSEMIKDRLNARLADSPKWSDG